ncbi:MAG TPA: hypothetical protein VLI94_00295 [Solirubrobacterales bacterium]|nr:hypothetical protein [Solirubrobacterales bacterium]
MKYVKMLGLLAVAVTALMAFAGTASATVTSPANTKLGKVVATSTNSELDGTVDITCAHSEVEAVGVNSSGVATAGSTTGRVDKLTFTNCNRTVTVTNRGHIFVHPSGTVTSTGARVTVQTTILGFPVHCIYVTNNTDVGTLTEGVAPAVMHIGSAPIDQEATSGLCGEDAEWTGTYTVTNPATAITVD